MQTFNNTFAIAGPWVLGVYGHYFQVLDSSGAVDVTLTRGNSPVATARGVESGFAVTTDEFFDGVIIDNAALGNSVKIFVGSSEKASYNRIAGLVDTRIRSANSLLNRPMINVPQNVETVICAANPARASLRIWNNGTADVFIGAAGLTLPDAAIKLAVGDVWIEECAAGCAWVALHNNAAAQVLKVQEAIY